MANHEPQIPIELLECRGLGAESLHEVDCLACGRCGRANLVGKDELEAFTSRVLQAYGVSEEEALITVRVLVASDLRGIPSHGVARLGRYIAGLKAGYIKPGVEFEVVEPAPAIASIDAKDGIGQVVSEQAMDLAIAKARANGLGLVTVRNSNHFGIAGYYAAKAVAADMIGICMTNAAPLVVPTYGTRALLGTNPIAFGAPATGELDFLLDTATSVVPRGKLEVYDRNEKQMPVGWSIDEKGFDCQNPGRVLKNLLARVGGGILPLGGRGEEFGGHKGYGLAMMVDVLSGVLSGSAFGPDVNNLKREMPDGQVASPRVGHFFLAMDVGRFMAIDDFKDRMGDLIRLMKEGPKALGEEEIYVHGEKEQRSSEHAAEDGIPLADNVFNSLLRIASEAKVEPPACCPDARKG